MFEISSKSSAPKLYFKIWYELAKVDLKNRYTNSYMGTFWNIGIPLIYAIINAVIFSILMKGRMGTQYGEIPFTLFYFIPLALWTFFTDVVGRSTGILREYAYLINKISFPFEVLPSVPIASALVNQVIFFIVISVLTVYYNIEIANTAWIYLVIWFACVILSLGVSYGVSALTVYIPDFVYIVPILFNIGFWITPILYPATLVENSDSAWIRIVVIDYNPFYYIVEESRRAVFGSTSVAWETLGFISVFSFLTLAIGLFVFKKLKSGFADVI